MKVILLANHFYAIPAINALISKQILQAIVMPDVKHQYNLQIEDVAKSNNIPYKRFAKSELTTLFKEWLTDQSADVVLAYTFPYKIPKELFAIATYGFFNVHYSLLPAYKGPFPVFWQIKNGDKTTGISIHKMDENFDTGTVLLQQEITIMPGETQGLCSAKLSAVSVNLISEFLTKITSAKVTKNKVIQPESYFSKPEAKDFTIYWDNYTATEIENLTNACNSEIGGAITNFRGQMLKFIEVSKATVNGSTPAKPGTIIYSDVNNGVFVACRDNEYIRVNIIQMAEGIFSGNKIASMGIHAGEVFE